MAIAALDRGQIEKIANQFAPDVVRVRVNAGEDWSGDSAYFFHVVLTDDASRPEKLQQIAEIVREGFSTQLDLWHSGSIPYFRFRSESEQAEMKDPAWT